MATGAWALPQALERGVADLFPAGAGEGAATDADQANGIIAAGRADLVAIGRPHLANPAWTLLEAARLEYPGTEALWPKPYLAGQAQLDRLLARERAARAAAEGAPPTGELT